MSKFEAKRVDWSSYALEAHSRGEEQAAYLRIQLGRLWISVPLADWIVRPNRRIEKATYWSPETIARMGRDWYEVIERRIYGFYVSDGFLHVSYGVSVGDSSRDEDWSCFLPWANWRFIGTSYYGANGEHVRTFQVGAEFDDEYEFRTNILPKRKFSLTDYDGAPIVATTHIEEREWRFGTKWCSWLSWFRRPRVRRSLEIEYDDEVGPEKGSWKGGLMGHGIDMLPGDTHESAMRRHCSQEHRSKFGKYRVAFVGVA